MTTQDPDIHLIVCKNPMALTYLLKDSCLLGFAAKKKIRVSQGDALCARDILIEAGFSWGSDFYLTKKPT